MESLPAAGTVRRTVRVAVALVVGQALLVGLIGWLTLGRAGGSDRAVDQLAAPPVTPRPANTSRYAALPAPPSTSAATPTPARRATSARRAGPATATSRAPRPSSPPATTVAPEPAPSIVVATTIVPPVPLVPALTPSPSGTPGPVVIGGTCAPEGVYAYTADGLLVRCARTWRHRLRWKIV
ncbi:hypothetical protein [Actinoplanes subtropicus]|uniref:hypothetical protein n=1 Tax=Actinoplanes subtropicus TaxID=543632 RepID=UPI0012F9A427|nr:hypothetical protein [Actinoplanes subtropicus]